ncbi:putative flap endonuclease-1-like 5' DNA nuclease [Lewinella marina]|uniref:AMP-activated protein kinase glycogen-binding domain-containing protein n=1 Tax=Neolewinella marina TaxID=438751 RepID=A0A2G0CJP6_9BACT|nr:helix-hairpin-helix domain-containing protein [Neolewinella marina]NJB84634.1 putative flap endonuclease-1-like 5' DNA nuclease [Neolewinella marina]PHL00192.1 hypothetical protein CGL56_03895 [Neolewinella marina]
MIKSTYVKSKQHYKVSFELPEDRVGQDRDVRVLGNFNDWNWENGLQLKAGKSGYSGSTTLPAGHYQFRYLVDGDQWHNDDHAEAYADSGHGTTNCCFSLEQVEEPKKTVKKAPAKAKKAPAKAKSAGSTIQAADSAAATKPVVTPKKTAAAKKTTAKASKTKGDDLKKIEGIGPKIAGLLNEAGIHTYSDLAKAEEKQLADVLQKAGARFRLAKHDTWQEQARLAADGKTEELKALQGHLKGGRK